MAERPTDVHVVFIRVHLKNMIHMKGCKIKDLTTGLVADFFQKFQGFFKVQNHSFQGALLR